jgi:hypothetical protein
MAKVLWCGLSILENTLNWGGRDLVRVTQPVNGPLLVSNSTKFDHLMPFFKEPVRNRSGRYDFFYIPAIRHLILYFMQYNIEVPESLKPETQEIVEIKLWGLYLLINRTNLYTEMIQASLDHGPVEKNPQNPGRVTFRFNNREWESRIKKLLYNYRVPVIIKSHAYQQLFR